MGLTHSPRIVTDGLVFCLDAANKLSYAGAGNTWIDLVGSNNGILTNGPTFSEENGGSVVFDGSDDYVTSPASYFNNILTDALTLEAFINISNTSGYQLIGGGQDNTLYRYTAAFNWNQVGETDKLGFDLEADGGQVRLVSTSTFTSNNWLHLVGTYDGSTAKFYINNTLEDTDTGTSGNINDFDGFILGRDINFSAGRVFNGKMACYKVYNKALTQQQIKQNYKALRGRFN
tara:strand:- start:16 stop:711 length:696 start_codon:yes stop_codon:yes gene_type:complete